MGNDRFSSLRVRLGLLVLLAVAPILGLTIYTDLEERELAVSEIEESVQRISQYAASDQEQLIEQTRQILVSLARLSELRDLNGERCATILSELLEEYPQFANIGTTLLDGRLICSALPVGDTVNGIDFSDQGWFQRVVQEREFAVGGYQVSSIAKRAVLHFGYPVLGADRELKAVLFAALDLEKLNQLSGQVELPQGAELMLLNQNGTILTYLPEPEKWVGKSIVDTPIGKTILREGLDVAELRGLDGVVRLYSFTPLRSAVETGLYACIGIPTAHAFSAANEMLLKNLMGLAVVCLLVFGAVWYGGNLFVLRGVRALLSAAQRLTEGDMKTRIGPPYFRGELGRLAGTFDEMAEALEQRTLGLHQAETKYRTLVEQLPGITYTANLDKQRTHRYISPQIKAILGFSPEEWIQDPGCWLRQIHPEDRDRVMEELGKTGSHDDSMRFSSQYRILTEAGRPLWFIDDAVMVIDDSDGPMMLQGIMRDVTQRKEAEEKLVEYQEQLRSLASQLSLAEERERHRISTELHDHVGQALAMAKIKLGVLREELSSSCFGVQVEEIRNLIEGAIQDTRSLLFQISSPILYELGFEAALEWLAEQTEKQHGIAAVFKDDERPKPMDEDIRILLFRATSELMTNVVKHAHAERVEVSAKREGSCIRVEVVDDGSGFDPSQIPSRWGKTEGFGLFSIRERLKHVNGSLDIVSHPGQGARVSLVAPLSKTPQE